MRAIIGRVDAFSPVEMWVEIPLDDRARKVQLGQIILIPTDGMFKMYANSMYGREEMKARDPKLSRTLNPPYGLPMFKQDAELEKWLKREVQIEAGRTNTKAQQAATQR